MASADLSQELDCPVCLAIYTDPVTLRCGHNFCRECIVRVLDTQEETGAYSCPESGCREVYKERPAMQKNIALKNIAERFLPTQLDQEEAGEFCTYCVDSPVPAVMSCLMCDVSLCDDHLRVHSKAPEHVLCPPTANLESRKCSVHKEILESCCVCVSCRLDGEHRGHRDETLDEASKKEKLRYDLKKLMAEMEKAKKRVLRLQEHRRNTQEKTAGKTKKVTAIFRDFRRVLGDITTLAELATVSYEEANCWFEEARLSGKMRHFERLCKMFDPLTVLQEAATGDLCDTEEGDNEDRERHDELHDGGDLDVAAISHTLYKGLSDIMSGVIVQERPDTPAHPHTSAEDKVPITAVLSRPQPQPVPTKPHPPPKLPRPHTKPTLAKPNTQPMPIKPHPQPTCSRPHPQPTHPRPHRKASSNVQTRQRQAGGRNTGSVQQTSGQPVCADIILDVDKTTGVIRISRNEKSASGSEKRQKRPNTEERFQDPQVISSHSFSSGRHHMEVDLTGSEECRVGMCYSSVARRGNQSVIGEKSCSLEKSWCFEKWWDDQYSLRHDRQKIQLPAGIPIHRVVIDLDYEAGRIAFYALVKPILRHLHTFTTTFTEPLHAAMWVLEGCMTLTVSNRK